METALSRKADHRQDSLRVPEPAVKRKLAQEEGAFHRFRHLPGSHQKADRDWKIVSRALFAQVGRR